MFVVWLSSFIYTDSLLASKITTFILNVLFGVLDCWLTDLSNDLHIEVSRSLLEVQHFG